MKVIIIEEDDIHKVYVPSFPYKILFTIENKHQIEILRNVCLPTLPATNQTIPIPISHYGNF